jgi:predicted negative regulator of RcsB-dependent stress response
VRSYTRQQLKQNAFAETTAGTITWAVAHRSKVIAASVVAAVIVAVLAGGWAFINYRNNQGQQELASAIQKYSAPIRPEGTPATPDTLSFGSIQERAKVANAEFTRIADKYSFTQSGALARYFEGLSFRDLGDNAAAEKQLKEVADSRHKEIASLAKLALGSLYEDTNQNSQALATFKELIDHPTASVGKTTAQLQLASLYESMQQPGEAAKIYQDMQKSNPTGPAGQIATQKLRSLQPSR